MVAVVLPLLLTAIGCSPYVRWPNLYHPGTAQQQQADALQYDPYPLDDVGPDIVGGRPPSYQRPVPEVERARDFWARLPGAGRAPAFTPAPTIQAAPAPCVPAPPTQPAPQGYAPAPPTYTPVPQGYVPAPFPQPTPTAPTPPPFRY